MDTATTTSQVIDLTSLKFLAGLGFSFVLILFLIFAFIWGRNLSHHQFTILKVLSALCAAIAAVLIAGEISVHKEGAMTISASSGFALFVIVWFVFPKYQILLEDGFNMSIPAGKTFQEIVNIIIEQDNAFVEFRGFNNTELTSTLKSRQLQTKTINEALKNLRLITENQNAISEYSVIKEGSKYILGKQ